MSRNLNDAPFDEATILKLEIFAECFAEWLPVFLHNEYTDEVHVFDFFAGSGTDVVNHPGSPLILIEAAKGKGVLTCKNASKPLRFSFNELRSAKFRRLQTTVRDHLESCRIKNMCEECSYEYTFSQREFKSLFAEPENRGIFMNRRYGKFLLLDQNGFKEIDDKIFQEIVSYPKTDFIFFISSSFVKRFKEHPNIKAYIDTSDMNFDESQPKECHRIIADYYRSLLPAEPDYYMHQFTIKKGSNYYGLIFGTGHTFGMEKFLKVCWRKDPKSGESNFNINNDWEMDDLFYDEGHTEKKVQIREELRSAILSGEIADNISGLKRTLVLGGLPELFVREVTSLEKDGAIKRIGKVNNSASRIHKAAKYRIEVQ